ncbi:MAG: carbohydrate binding domain-containing protein [Planctomycetota bacterium]|nr:carbohydrate binding domain-containing protein [Planctomycetota bacterium]
MKSHPRKSSRNHRRGSIYIVTLGSSLIVAVLGLAALKSVSVHREQSQNVADSLQAQLNARTGLDVALLRIDNNSNWRTQFQSGAWSSEQSAVDGTFQIVATDPIDGDLLDDNMDPVVITSTGRMGDAVQKLQFELEPARFGLSILQAGLGSGNDLTFDGGIAVADHFVSANRDAIARNTAQVGADAEAGGVISTFSGGQFLGSTTTAGDWPRELPDTNSVLDYYLANGTAISINDIPDWDGEIIDNGTVSGTIEPWQHQGGTLSLGTDRSGQPNEALMLDGIDADTNHIWQDVTGQIENGMTYTASAWAVTEDVMDMRLMLDITSTGGGLQTFALSPWIEVEEEWLQITGQNTVSWTGTLQSAKFYVQISGEEGWMKLDDVVVKSDDAQDGWKAIHGVVISPNSNPFGPTTNPQGIYVIDAAGGEKLSLRDIRVEGTLVILNQHADTQIHGSVVWEPAVYSTTASPQNLPALITNKSLNIAFDNTPLDEATVGANFNPVGTPYLGVADADLTDSYPSSMKGVIYSMEQITLKNQPTINGVVVSGTDMLVENATLNLTYDSVYYEKNPPPGFEGDITVYVKAGSFQKVVD